jgi:hypothetical protein
MRHERPLLVKDGITGEKWSVKLACYFDFHVNHMVLLHGQTALLPLGRKACCGFFRPKNPTASAGFEPAILGTLWHANR